MIQEKELVEAMKAEIEDETTSAKSPKRTIVYKLSMLTFRLLQMALVVVTLLTLSNFVLSLLEREQIGLGGFAAGVGGAIAAFAGREIVKNLGGKKK